jgi:stalled ribosome rescue protein Dom34
MTERAPKKHLDRDVSVEVVVVRLPHFAHASFADHFDEAVPAKHGAWLKRDGAAGIKGHTEKLAALS